MTHEQDMLSSLLLRSAERLRVARAPALIARGFERLAGQVDQPCVIAVVGRVKAGKSSFVNALLGEDLARVGVTETTATINYFTFGTADPDYPIRCHWQNGQVTRESRAFLDGLQGRDEDTLRRAAGIEYLEYRLPNSYLQRVTLVDTPGMAAVVDEHQDRVSAFLGVQAQMRTRNLQETERLQGEADAVIYVMGQVARTTDQAFLEEFSQTRRGRVGASNAVGIITRIDLQPEIMAHRAELASRIAHQLADSLNTVVPVSAGLQRSLQRSTSDDNQNGLQPLADLLVRVPAQRLEMMLDSEEFYRDFDFPDCPVSPEERTASLGEMPWTVFTTIAHTLQAAGFRSEVAVPVLKEMAGFEPLKQILEKRFYERGHLLRAFRIVADARRLLDDVRYSTLPQIRRQEHASQERLTRFQAFVAGAPGDAATRDAATRRDLADFLAMQQGLGGQAGRLEMTLQEIDRDLAHVFHRLEEENADFVALQELGEDPDAFSETERIELVRLFGRYGIGWEERLPEDGRTEVALSRQARVWMRVERTSLHPVRREVAEQAAACYSRLLDQLLSPAAE